MTRPEKTSSPDPRLPDWGPYTKKYIGISHCSDKETGLRFDLSVFPGLYRRAVRLPNVRSESDYHPWEISPELDFIRHRHQLIWKDRLYCDISFVPLPGVPSGRLIEIEAVNRGEEAENLCLHFLASLHPASAAPVAEAALPEGMSLIPALSYSRLVHREDRPDRHLQPDGRKRGETAQAGAIGGYALLLEKDHPALLSWERPGRERCLTIRYRGGPALLKMPSAAGGPEAPPVELPPSREWTLFSLALPPVRKPKEALALELIPREDFFWDALFLSDRREDKPLISLRRPRTELTLREEEEGIILSSGETSLCYGLARPAGIPYELRLFRCDQADELFREIQHEHVKKEFARGEAPFSSYRNLFLRPIDLKAGETRKLYGFLCSGSREEVRRALALFSRTDRPRREAAIEEHRRSCFAPEVLPGGEKYLFSQQRMAATVNGNVVFPIRTRGRFIRHYTPGRWWDSLYTWDSGCIGLGQLELSPLRGTENLKAYLCAPGDDEAAFIHHGSLLPTQFLLFQSLWNRLGDRALLKELYPRMRRCHEFLMGRPIVPGGGRSTTRTLSSGLLRPWDYFYNSGGWDDYPPQVAMHRLGLADRTTPVINSAFAVRSAKILIQAARSLGEETAPLEQDVRELSGALQEHCWDPEAGYFSYLLHDEQGRPAGIFRDEEGTNFNRGLDGVSPLLADICSEEQLERLVAHLTNPEELWSPAGLSTVDQSAPYYRREGYWNGAVWMPHQWFLWRALLDCGLPREARRIARTALDLWAEETGKSYNCFEHFLIATRRGAGWHQFSGLSSPVLSWFASYYVPGRITGGFNAWREKQNFSADHRRLEARYSFLPSSRRPCLLITMAPGPAYRLLVDRWEPPKEDLIEAGEEGRFCLLLPRGCREAQLSIAPV